jgi:hypothetical protein
MKTKFIIFIVLVVIVIGGFGLYLNSQPTAPSKFDGLALALKSSGANFYGAFWCPHCQEQKAEFGSSKQYLPYVECANPDNSQTQVCIDNKIESYPSWTFKNGIKITSASDPVICPIQKEGVKEEAVCANAASQFYRVWIFQGNGFSIKSPTDPIKNGNIWQFPSGSYAVGKMELSALAEQIQFVLPQ